MYCINDFFFRLGTLTNQCSLQGEPTQDTDTLYDSAGKTFFFLKYVFIFLFYFFFAAPMESQTKTKQSGLLQKSLFFCNFTLFLIRPLA